MDVTMGDLTFVRASHGRITRPNAVCSRSSSTPASAYVDEVLWSGTFSGIFLGFLVGPVGCLPSGRSAAMAILGDRRRSAACGRPESLRRARLPGARLL